ncbi:MAG: 50S ribosome-binding GTPase, partial [Planctomycetes bacterium]|nr:50S ribosome-binding GTPase [Planctomycetota bacterium]
ALAHVADARTERTAAVLLDQHHGALRRALEGIQRELRAGPTAAALRELHTLLARADVGRHLVRPWRVILAGLPNVGKSSLINALVGHERAIVHPTAGTTRDVVSAATAINGWPVELADTAGLRESEHRLERAAVELARQESASADLALLVFDSSRPWSEADQTLVEGRPDGLVIHNKCDLPACSDRRRPNGLSTSALAGRGIENLLQAIVDRLVPDPPSPGAAVPFTADQIERIEAAAGASEHNDVPAALAALRNVLG